MMLIARRILNRLRGNAIHLFLLSPPLCGSTLVAQLLATSSRVTVFPEHGEGQFLPEAKPILFVKERWNPALPIDWQEVKRIFLSYWSPLRLIRFEKSPPLVVRALELEQTFDNAHFLITIRNPYAQIEGIVRRQWPLNHHGPYGPSSVPSGLTTPGDAARFWVRVAQYQLRNIEQLARTCFFSYEQLTRNPDATIRRIQAFLPAIGTLDKDIRFTAHNITQQPIQGIRNLNAEKIRQLTPDQIREINGVLSRHRNLLDRFGYRLMDERDGEIQSAISPADGAEASG